MCCSFAVHCNQNKAALLYHASILNKKSARIETITRREILRVFFFILLVPTAATCGGFLFLRKCIFIIVVSSPNPPRPSVRNRQLNNKLVLIALTTLMLHNCAIVHRARCTRFTQSSCSSDQRFKGSFTPFRDLTL